MKAIGKLLSHRWIVVSSTSVLLALLAATSAEAQQAFTFQWRAHATVKRPVAADSDSTTHYETSDTSVLMVVRDPTPDVRFALEFNGPAGHGSGAVPRVADQSVDPNFAYPSPLPPGLPPAQTGAVRGSFRRLVEGVIPPAFQIVYVETFTCHTEPSSCGGVSSWEVIFVGNARSVGASPR